MHNTSLCGDERRAYDGMAFTCFPRRPPRSALIDERQPERLQGGPLRRECCSMAFIQYSGCIHVFTKRDSKHSEYNDMVRVPPLYRRIAQVVNAERVVSLWPSRLSELTLLQAKQDTKTLEKRI